MLLLYITSINHSNTSLIQYNNTTTPYFYRHDLTSTVKVLSANSTTNNNSYYSTRLFPNPKTPNSKTPNPLQSQFKHTLINL